MVLDNIRAVIKWLLLFLLFKARRNNTCVVKDNTWRNWKRFDTAFLHEAE